MVFFVCGCGLSATTKQVVADKRLCVECGGSLQFFSDLPLSFWSKHKVFKELDEDGLSGKRKLVFEAIKVLQPCSDADVAKYLGWGINRVTPRRGELYNDFALPFIKPFGTKTVHYEDRDVEVTLWGVC